MSKFDAKREAEFILDLWGEAAERVAVRKARWSAEEGDFERAAEWWEIQKAVCDLKNRNARSANSDIIN